MTRLARRTCRDVRSWLSFRKRSIVTLGAPRHDTRMVHTRTFERRGAGMAGLARSACRNVSARAPRGSGSIVTALAARWSSLEPTI